MQNLEWTRKPKKYIANDNKTTIIIEPNTDLRHRTYNDFMNDKAPVLQMKTTDKYFSLVVKIRFNNHSGFDQSGIVMYINCVNRIKASVEYENE